MEAIRVLHVLGSLGLGGAESRIMDLYRNIDREKIQFDFLVHTSQEGHYEEEVKALGGRIFRVPRFKVYNYLTYERKWKEFFRQHSEIKVVHGHMTSTASIYLPIARKSGVPMTIAHARSAGVDPGLKGKLTLALRRNLFRKTDYCFTCSALAGEAVFGKKAMDDRRVQLIPNAIEAAKYVYDEKTRNYIRQKLGLEGQFVIGHVGRFGFMKNHSFLLDIFQEVAKRIPKAVLMLLGEGEEMENIRLKARNMGLEDRVLFLGNQDKVSDYYQAMDYFVFPSLFEGLPGTVVEAQAAGLRCLISDSITEEVAFSPLVTRFSLQKTAEEWARQILEKKEYRRENTLEIIKKAGFDVSGQVDWLTSFYQTAVKKKIMLLVPMLHQGGFERVCVLTARLLQPRHQVFICLNDLTDLAYDIEKLSLIHLHLPARPGKVGKVVNVVKRCRAVRFWKKRLNIDITYSFGPTANLVNVFSRNEGQTWCGIRSYMDLEDSRLLRLFCTRADKVICCSRLIEKELKERYGDGEITTLYNPYDEAFIAAQAGQEAEDLPWKKEDSFTIVSMGREDDVKGYWHLLKAFWLVAGEKKEARLMLIGEGDFKEYKKLARELGVEDRFYCTGMKKNPYPYLNLGKLYVLNSYYEGFPNALVEAMTLRIPVIATNCMTGPAEILLKDYHRDLGGEIRADYGLLIPNMSPEKNLRSDVIDEQERKLAALIVQLMEDKGLYAEYAALAKQRSGDFSYESYVKELEKLME